MGYQQRQFLTQVRPAVLHGWAVLEETPIDYPYNAEQFNLSKAETDRAVSLCLGNIEQLEGLAQVLALCWRSGRCSESRRKNFLQQSYEIAKQLSIAQPLEYWADLFCYRLGNGFYDLDQFEEAIAAYDAALTIQPEFPEALYNKGTALNNLGRYEEAISAHEAALDIEADKYEAWNNQGFALLNLERYEEALVSCNSSLELNPNNYAAYCNKISALVNLGRYEQAISACSESLLINPQGHEAFYNKACCYSLQGQVEPALENLERAIQLNPDKYREMAKTDTDFDAIWEDPRFQALVEGGEE